VSEAAVRGPFARYLGGLSSWFIAQGIQTVLFPWLAAVVLGQPPAMVGLAQMALTAPSILLMLYAGAVADRGDARAILLRVQIAAALPPLGLAALIYAGGLSFELLLAYGVVMGALQAFAVPARDSILPQVVSGPLARAVALATSLQFASQMVGIVAATFADTIGAVILLCLQAVVVALGALIVQAVHVPPVAHAGVPSSGRLQAMLAGLRAARRDQRIWPVLCLMLAIGVFYGGTFVVVIPIAVRDVYGRSADGIGLTNFAFWIGTIATSFAAAGLAARIRRPGIAVLCAATYGVCVLVLLGTLPRWPLMLVACFAWGLGAGVTMTQGRTIVQTLAPPDMRGRMLALYQLGFLGGTPIGALLMGSITQVVGPSIAMWIGAGCMSVVLTLLVSFTRMVRLRL
jgi:MFS family permease